MTLLTEVKIFSPLTRGRKQPMLHDFNLLLDVYRHLNTAQSFLNDCILASLLRRSLWFLIAAS